MARHASIRLLRRYAPLLLLGAALVEIGAYGFFARRYPRFDEYAELAEIDPGPEPLVIAPAWAEPLVRRALGDRWPLATVAWPDLESAPRVIEIDVLGDRAPELAGWREKVLTQFDSFSARLMLNPAPARATVDFVDELGPAARVELHGDGVTPCVWREDADVIAGGLGGNPTFPRRRFVCPTTPFLNAGVTVIADEDFRPRRCIWAHPPRRGELVIRFPAAPLGTRIVGHGGMYWMIERGRAGAPIDLAVSVDGDPIGVVTHRDGDGWARFELGLGEHAGRRGAVRFAVSSSDWQDRHFCFEARSLEDRR